jgi:hypothetical protein
MKTPTLFAGLLAALCSVCALAAEPADPFTGLETHEIKGYLTAALHYDPQITEVVNRRLTGEDEPLVVRVLRTRLDRTQAEWYFVDYDEGPSADPAFIITLEGAEEPAGALPGLHLYLPGNGSLYTTGHANTMFDERRKYAFQGGRLAETNQPYLYVGIEGKAKKDLTIYASPAQQEAVAAIPQGSAITLLLADGVDRYLVKTSFGLVGWVTIPSDSQQATVVDGLFFAGD